MKLPLTYNRLFVYHRFEAEHDDYNIIMVKALADRLVEVQAIVFISSPCICYSIYFTHPNTSFFALSSVWCVAY